MEYKRFTEKRKGKNVIPLRNAVCGFGMPKWSIAEESDIQSFLSGDAVDRLAELEDKIENGTLIDTESYYVREEPIYEKQRWLVCSPLVIEGIVAFAKTREEAEQRLLELKGEER